MLADYESLLLRYSKEYCTVDHRNATTAALADFFSPGTFESAAFHNSQRFELGSLAGRLLSSSYAPKAGEEGHDPMIWELRKLFELHPENGLVEFLYKTEVYFGRLADS